MHLQRYLVSTAVLVLLITGCTSKTPEAPSTETSSSSPTAVATKTSSGVPVEKYHPATASGPATNVEVPQLPKEARQNTEDGAKAFAEYYFDLINYVVETNKTGPIKKVTTRQCQFCGEAIIDPAALGQRLGVWQVGGKHHGNVTDSYKATDNRATVTVNYWISESTVYRKPNVVDSTLKKTDPTDMILDLAFDGSWKVDAISGGS